MSKHMATLAMKNFLKEAKTSSRTKFIGGCPFVMTSDLWQKGV